jgi:hypothetical protein
MFISPGTDTLKSLYRAKLEWHTYQDLNVCWNLIPRSYLISNIGEKCEGERTPCRKTANTKTSMNRVINALALGGSIIMFE